MYPIIKGSKVPNADFSLVAACHRSCSFSVIFTIFGSQLYLPPAYVVRREGTVFTGVCLSTGGGYPYPIMLCNISQNAMGQRGGGYLTGYPPRGGTQSGGVPDWVPPLGGYPVGGVTQLGTPPGGYPVRGGTWPGTPQGVPDWVPPRGVPDWVPPRGYLTGYPPGGGTQVGQQKGVLTTRRAVCLLRSRRRTFLFVLGLCWNSCSVFRMALIFTNFWQWIRVKTHFLLENLWIASNILEKLQSSSVLPNIKYNCAALFLRQIYQLLINDCK